MCEEWAHVQTVIAMLVLESSVELGDEQGQIRIRRESNLTLHFLCCGAHHVVLRDGARVAGPEDAQRVISSIDMSTDKVEWHVIC